MSVKSANMARKNGYGNMSVPINSIKNLIRSFKVQRAKNGT